MKRFEKSAIRDGLRWSPSLRRVFGRALFISVSINTIKLKTCVLFKAARIETNAECGLGACPNNGSCLPSTQDPNGFKCECARGFKGRYCEHEKSGTSNSTWNSRDVVNSTCPAKWWGRGFCGPCECDESKNFSPDCDKFSGQCTCKSKFFLKMDKASGETRCVPCDCYLEGSLSLECEPLTGQCQCLSGAGIKGRRCDQCVSPFAEFASKGSECRQIAPGECPRAFKFNIWWGRTPLNTQANSSCPKGAFGIAFLRCTATGWANVADVSDCKSAHLVDSQLFKWHQTLIGNLSMLNAYQALQLTEDLQRMSAEAEREEQTDEDTIPTGPATLYASDVLVVEELARLVIRFEVENAPSFLYIQDKHFLINIFSTLNRILGRKYELKLSQFKRSVRSFDWAQLMLVMANYLEAIAAHTEHSAFSDKLELSLSNVKLRMGRSGETNLGLIKLNVDPALHLVPAISIDTSSKNLPFQLEGSDAKFKPISNLLIVAINAPESNVSSNAVFVLSKMFEVDVDSPDSLLRGFKLPYSNFFCARLSNGLWSLQGTRLNALKLDAHSVECEITTSGVYVVLSSPSELFSLITAPINFLISAYVILSATLTFLFLTLLVLLFLKVRARFNA